MNILPLVKYIPLYNYSEDTTMAVDVRDMSNTRSSRLGGEQDTSVVSKMMVIAGGALVFLVAIKIGFLRRVFA